MEYRSWAATDRLRDRLDGLAAVGNPFPSTASPLDPDPAPLPRVHSAANRPDPSSFPVTFAGAVPSLSPSLSMSLSLA